MSALLALLKQKQQDMAASRRSRTEKIPEGSSRWRLFGSWRGEGQQFWHDFGQHFVKDSAGALSAIYMCTEKTYGKPCQICEAINHGLKGATDEATENLLGEAKSAGRILLNGMRLDGEDPHKMHITEFPGTVFEMVIAIAAEWEDAGETIFGPKGKDLLITRTGKGKQTKYAVQVAAKSMAIPADAGNKLNDLDAYVAQESTEAMNRALNSVRAVADLLPAPTAGAAGLPAAARVAAELVEEDPYAVATPPKRRAAPPAEFEDVPPFDADPPSAPVVKPATAKVAAPAAPAIESTGDDDLDSLLKSLG